MPSSPGARQKCKFVLCVLWGRDDLYRCLDQRFYVLRVREWAACHHVDDFLACGLSWLPAVYMRGMDRGGVHDIHGPGKRVPGATIDVGDAQGELALLRREGVTEVQRLTRGMSCGARVCCM